MICKNCQKEVNDQASFCSNCGTSVSRNIEHAPMTWKHRVYIILGIIITIFSSGEGFHLSKIEWWIRSFFAILPLLLISATVALMISKSQKKIGIDLSVFSKTLLIVAMLFAFGLFYSNYSTK